MHQAQQLAARLFDVEEVLVNKYDVKPSQCSNSAERAPWFALLTTMQWQPGNDPTLLCGGDCGDQCHGRACWHRLVGMFERDRDWLHQVRRTDFVGRHEDFIDYSVVFLVSSHAGEHDASSMDLPDQC